MFCLIGKCGSFCIRNQVVFEVWWYNFLLHEVNAANQKQGWAVVFLWLSSYLNVHWSGWRCPVCGSIGRSRSHGMTKKAEHRSGAHKCLILANAVLNRLVLKRSVPQFSHRILPQPVLPLYTSVSFSAPLFLVVSVSFSVSAARLLDKFSAIYGTRGFNTVFTRARHGALSWAIWIHPQPHILLL